MKLFDYLATWGRERMSIRAPERDGCQFCFGQNRGVPGNENRIAEFVVCDYCTVKLQEVEKAERVRIANALEGIASECSDGAGTTLVMNTAYMIRLGRV